MSKKCYRFFGGALGAQEKWLNRMAAQGFRLARTEKLLYEFEECGPGQYEYRVEFVGQKSRKDAEDYRQFLEDLGYRTFYKNINLSYTVGKVRWRPWAEPGGRIATNATTYDRELLIVEKEADGKPFELHTTYEDQIACAGVLRGPWLCIAAVFVFFGVVFPHVVFWVLAALSALPALYYQVQIWHLRREAKTKEW